jgi:outer membrane murein-binding lipoprotein Lpp
MLPSSSSWQQLEADIRRLNARIDELEKKLKTVKNREE